MGFPLNTRSGGGTQATDAQRLGGTQRHQVLVPVPLVGLLLLLLLFYCPQILAVPVLLL